MFSDQDFKVRTLGNLFVPLTKTYAGLIHHMVGEHRPDIPSDEAIYTDLINLKSGIEQRRYLLEFTRKYQLSPFDLRIFKIEENGIQLPQGYLNQFVREFEMGHFHRAKADPIFSFSSVLRKKVLGGPSVILVSSKAFRARYIAATQQFIDSGIPVSERLFKKVSMLGPEYPLSTLMEYPRVPTRQFEYRPKFSIDTDLYFDSDAALKVRFMPEDMRFHIAAIYGMIDVEGTKAKNAITITITSKKRTLVDVSHKFAFIYPKKGIVEKRERWYIVFGDAEKYAVEKFLKETKIIKKIKTFLGTAPKYYDFAVSIIFVPSKDGDGGVFAISGYLIHEVSRFAKGDFHRAIREISYGRLSFWLNERLREFIEGNLPLIAIELDPDKIITYVEEFMQK